MAQERASPPRTPQRAIQLAPNLIDSAHESTRSILARLGANSRRRERSVGRVGTIPGSTDMSTTRFTR
eukprot:scaffold21064_cov37-Phaeocystis_antarctica.AAC.1